MHDALVKTMPGKAMAPSLAESWTVSPDGKTYDFKLRPGLKFHNGDPFTAEDVKFSFQRAKDYKILKDKVREVEVAGPLRVRIHLNEAWPDFLTFYGTMVAGAGWIVPRKYVEQVGDDGFKKQPVGLGPYKFVSHTPGVELVLEAFEGYWRKVPSVKRLVFKSVPEATTRFAMLKRGEIDVAYLLGRALRGAAPEARALRAAAVYFARPPFCMARQTRSGRSGMSRWRTPNGLSASTTALTSAGVEPMVAASPMPLAPSGLKGETVTVWSVTKNGRSSARGIA
jgi:ABC-type transport system substrate-binding protein